MASGAQLRRSVSPSFEDGIGYSSESSSNSGLDINADSEDETDAPSQKRKHLRWLHAGLLKDAKGAIRDIWYAFKKDRTGRYKIIYASNWLGTSFANRDVGRRKSDLITWDKHHSDKWSRFITARGTWVCKRAMAGRALQRKSLLKTWLDPNSPNPYRHGKDNDRILGPPLNVVHTTADHSPGRHESKKQKQANSKKEDEKCYPGTEIPFSTIRIVVGSYKDYDKDPLTVIADFLTGQLARHPKFKRYRTDQNDQIESAFYECGWRINRRALEKANDSILLGKAENAFQSKAWRKAQPLWVDKYKGDQLNMLLNQMRDDMGEHGDFDIDDSDDESSETTAEPTPRSDSEGQLNRFPPRSLRTVAGPSKGKSTPQSMQARRAPKASSKLRNSDALRKSVQKRVWKNIEDEQNSNATDEELDFLPENSTEKGKGRAVKKARIRKQIAEASSDEEDDEVGVEEEEEEQTKVGRLYTSPSAPQTFKSAVISVDSSDDDSDMEILEDLSTPVGLKAESPPYHSAPQLANVSAPRP
ncbi:hypothetical protein BKA64DRAFT_741758 [Cadophora sp. MPI-SDFR-AT-0126]|nr:hypothetical protein BKA64DRAFT_741758 [Leotiomycetes sp. MPI-SDFR-AT-0126]